MPSITFSGLASGLDTAQMIRAIIDAKSQPLKRLQARQAVFSQRRSAFDELRSKLNAFESALRDLSSEATFRGRATSVSDESMLKATASTGAETGLFTLRVDQLAAAHKVKSEALIAPDIGAVTDGTITIQSGDNDEISIDVSAASGNNTLQAVRDAINSADAGVQAAIIFDGSDYLLTVRAEDTGTDNALTISDTTNLDLANLDNQVSAAADAQLVVDGILISSSSNTVTQIIPGVTLNLLSADDSKEFTLEVTQDVDTVVEATQNLIDQYNEAVKFFGEHNNREDPGVLAGDSTLLRIQQQLQSLFTGGAEGIALGQIRSLSTIGVSFDGRTGEAELDTARLKELLATNFDEIGNLFLASGTTTDQRVSYVSSTTSTANGEYAVEITQAAEQATLVGSAVISALNKDEDLTITMGSEQVTVNLLKDMQIGEVVDTINAELIDAEIEAYAIDDGGKLRITTKAFGSDVELSVISSRNDNGNGKRTGFDNSLATDTGQDVAGTIGGVEAAGRGQTLTGATGEEFDGLLIKVTATAADVAATGGDFGTVSYSRGLITDVLSRVEDYTRFDSGVLDLAREGLGKNIDRITDDIQRLEDRLAGYEARLVRTFSAAERAISALQSQQAAIGGFGAF